VGTVGKHELKVEDPESSVVLHRASVFSIIVGNEILLLFRLTRNARTLILVQGYFGCISKAD
jgi:hypothetical protein